MPVPEWMRSASRGAGVGALVVLWVYAFIALPDVRHDLRFWPTVAAFAIGAAWLILPLILGATMVWARRGTILRPWSAAFALGVPTYCGLVLPEFVAPSLTTFTVSDDWRRAAVGWAGIVLVLVVLPITLAAAAAAAGLRLGRGRPPVTRKVGLLLLASAAFLAVVPSALFATEVLYNSDGARAAWFFVWLAAYPAALGAVAWVPTGRSRAPADPARA